MCFFNLAIILALLPTANDCLMTVVVLCMNLHVSEYNIRANPEAYIINKTYDNEMG